MKMMRTGLGSLLLLVFCAAGVGCNDQDTSDESITLEVEVVDWNGWDPDFEPKPVTTTTEVSPGSTFEVEVLGDDATFEVTSISDEEIEFETDESFSPVDADGSFNMLEPEDEFTLDRSGHLELATPTTDGGTHVTLREA